MNTNLIKGSSFPFINAIKNQILRQDIIDEYGNKIKIVFTPIHGTGNIPVRRTLEEVGFKNVITVKEQEMPDPDFSTVKSPNPEDASAFEYAIKRYEEVRTLSEHFVIKNCKTKEIIYQQ